MKSPSRHLPESSRFLFLFPFFSLVFHITLFFLLQSLSSGQHQNQIKEDEIIAMVDLKSLKLIETGDEEKEPEALKELALPLPLPEKTPALEPEPMQTIPEGFPSSIGPDILASLSQVGGDLNPEEVFEEIEEPGLDPSGSIPEGPFFDESDALPVEEVLSDPETEEVSQALEEALTEQESLAEEGLLYPETEALPPEPVMVPEGISSDPEAGEETLALADEAGTGGPDPEGPGGEPGEGPGGASPEGSSAAGQLVSESGEELSSDSEQAPSPPEGASPDSPAGSGEVFSEEGLLAPAQRNAKEKKVPPSPQKKPSKEKIKKVGLLGLLGGGGGGAGGIGNRRGGGTGRLLMAKNRLRSKTRSPEKEERFSHRSLKATQKVAGLRKKVVSSERKRLMRRKPVGRKSRSGIKIVHGSGRNFGIISSAIRQKKGRLTNVYNRLLQNYENLQGNLIIEFVISPGGRVIKSQILTSSIANPSFEKALIKEIRRWRFPSVKTGQTTVLYPLSFFPSS